MRQYVDKIMTVVNNIKLLVEEFAYSTVVEKVITTLLERYESKISSLKKCWDLLKISILVLINALYAHEQRGASRREEHVKDALRALRIKDVNLKKKKEEE